MTRRAAVLAAVGVVLGALAVPAAAQTPPTNDAPERAVALSGPVSGAVGRAPPIGGAGRMLYYRFEYPGDGSTATVELELRPGDVVTVDGAGARVYGPTGGRLYAETAGTNGHPSERATFSSNEPGSYLVQVFNYTAEAVAFYLVVRGVPAVATPVPAPPAGPPPAPTPTATAAPVGDNDAPERAVELNEAYGGELPGDPTGRFRYFRIAHPGGGRDVRVELAVAPSDAVTVRSTGFGIYGLDGREVTTGGPTGASAPTHSATLHAAQAGAYLLQIRNYGPTTVRYQVRLTAGS